MAFREYPDHHPYWCTFTYAEEPDTWDTASHHIEKHLKRLNRFKTKINIPAGRSAIAELSASPYRSERARGARLTNRQDTLSIRSCSCIGFCLGL